MFRKTYPKLLLIFFLLNSVCTKQKTKPQQKITPLKIKKAPVKYPKYVDKNYVLGKFDSSKHPDFIEISKELSSKTIYLRRDVFKMFHKMMIAAKKEGIDLKIISGTRSFAHQKRIWNYKWNTKYKELKPLERAKKILEYSSMPSTSRHHWGTDIDINSLKNSYFLKGKGLKEYNWLVQNAHKFGFYQVYTSKKNGRTGYNEEKWHWSYVPLSRMYLKYYNQHITNEDILDFKGSHFTKEPYILENYVNGINPKIKDSTANLEYPSQ